MKKLLIAAIAVLTFAACNRTKDNYTIEGSFDLPSSYQLGDTVISLDPPAGYVFLCAIDGTPLDSALIEEGKFKFSGYTNPENPIFAYIMSEYAAGMFAVEPGEMKCVVSEPLRVTGTPTNDAIVSLMDRVDDIGIQMYQELQAIHGTSGEESLKESDITPIYEKYSSLVSNMIDSLYRANDDNLIGVYCANVMTVQAQSVEELEMLVAPFSKYVRESELIQQHFSILREAPGVGSDEYLSDEDVLQMIDQSQK